MLFRTPLKTLCWILNEIIDKTKQIKKPKCRRRQRASLPAFDRIAMNDSPWERAPFYSKFKKQSEFRLRIFGILLAPALRAFQTCGVRDGPPSGGAWVPTAEPTGLKGSIIGPIHLGDKASSVFSVPPWEVESAPRVSCVNQSGRHVRAVEGRRWEVGGGGVKLTVIQILKNMQRRRRRPGLWITMAPLATRRSRWGIEL